LIEAGRVVRNGDLYCCDINHQGEAKGFGGGISEGGVLVSARRSVSGLNRSHFTQFGTETRTRH